MNHPTATKTVRPNANLMEKEINLCIKWLQTVPTVTKAINYERSSYGYKHDVERWAQTYISNDSFKMAAHRMGLTVVQVSQQNECYNIKVLKTTIKNKIYGT